MPFTSPFPRLSIPDNVDLWQMLFERKNKPFPDDKKIVTCAQTGRNYTFAELRQTAREFGQGLKTRWGWKKGDVLLIFSPNHVDTPAVMLGAIWAGAVVSPANPLYTANELAYQLRDSGAKALVTQRAFLPTALEAARRVGLSEDRVVLIGEPDSDGRFRHVNDVRSTSSSFTSRFAKVRVDTKTDLAFLVYSSGTTGLAKGVRLSHYNLVANLLQYDFFAADELRAEGGFDGQGDKQLGILPFFHIYGLVCCVLCSTFKGVELVVLERFDMEKALRAIQTHGITTTYVPPPIILALGKHPLVDKYDLSSLKMITSAAAPLTRELTEAVWERLKIPVRQGYGMSETSPIVTTQRPDEWAKYVGSVGKLVPNMEAKIVGEDGAEVRDGEPGELWVKGPNIFLGYLNQPERTKEAFSECGYFKTGDIFTRDAKGNLYCVDRLKELIKYKGFQVPPAELEGLIVSHADVLDVCVIGIEDREQATEVPRAYVVLKPGVERTDAKARELADWVAGHVAPHKRLRGGVVFIDQVPKSPSGKILRRVLRDQAKGEGERGRGVVAKL